MSVAELISRLASTQKELVKVLQDEYYCDDLEPPMEAFGWGEQALRDFMESGGEAPASTTAPTPPDVSDAPAAPPAAAVIPAAPPAEPENGPPGRPVILCLGDATVEFGSHVIDLPTADVGGNGKKVGVAFVTDPVASEFLRGTETDNPGVEHGPGWVTLLARDYAWRTSADVINRGYSGYNSALLLADLPEILSTLRRSDVSVVVISLGANDAVAPGERTHVPISQFSENMTQILSQLEQACPKAKVVLMSPYGLDEKQWQATVAKQSGKRRDGTERSLARTLEYAAALDKVSSLFKRAAFLDVAYKIKYEMSSTMMEMQNPHRDGLHYTRAINIFLYRKLVALLSDKFDLSPSKVPRHRPKALDAFYPGPRYADDDGHIVKYIPKSRA